MTTRVEFSGEPREVLDAMKVFLGGLAQALDAPVYKPDPVEAAVAQDPDEAPETKDVTGRMYGAPSDGKARRTKAEMEQDAEIDTLAEKLGLEVPEGVADDMLEALKTRAGDATHAPEEVASISTGEERVDPEQPDETPEAEIVYTLDDVRDSMTKYVEKFGMPQMQKEGPRLLGHPKLSVLSEHPDDFAAAIGRMEAEINA